ncbi:glycine betaine/proline transport system substrate-binding protein [Marininema mesophilum]|uniref:Glycine betaine/proline transport system substrate-binding protein n=1 Tax=Marininema mesophilum TaxID=1048340 RepID=A0A1H2Q263_9BACL|nr:ABC transporter permease/substrate binding protein [Marininema mesophilum]SDW00774.1 glycine betaine/proline transport system substrate-binding protein [Marininema mesophilum]
MILPKKIPLDQWINAIVKWLQDNLTPLFTFISGIIEPTVNFFQSVLTTPPTLVAILALSVLVWLITRLRIGIYTLVGLSLIESLGYWNESAETIALVLTATAISIIIGLPLGIIATRSRGAQNVIMPFLDFMQTMPAFVYLIPAVFFFSLGTVPGIIASVIFAMPPTIRLTNLGIRQVDSELIEAADAFGATSIQKLFKVQLPLAKTTIMAGINQTIMLSLSMVVVASMIGAGGLGTIVLRAITRLEVGVGFEGGLCIVVIAILLDRITQSLASEKPVTKVASIGWFRNHWRGAVASILALSLLVFPVTYQPESAKKTVTLTYVNWDSEVASSNVLKAALEQAGFNVKLLEVDLGPMFAGVASGAADGTVAAWLPVQHQLYVDKYKSQIKDLGPNLEGTTLGLVVPSYVKANSVSDMKGSEGQFKKEIIGIEAGSDMMKQTEKLIKDYKLDMKLVESSSAAMAATLEKAYKAKKPVVVVGWKPHWMFAKMKLKFLKDPRNEFGQKEKVHTIVNKDLQSNNPKAYKIMNQFNWEPKDMEKVMLDIRNGDSPSKAAKNWIKANPEKVKEWMK